MIPNRILAAIAACLALGAAVALGASAAANDAAPAPAATAAAASGNADARVNLLKILPSGTKLEDLRPAPVPNVYELVQGADVSYITADGKYFFDGNLYDVKSRENLSEQVRTQAREAMLKTIPESEMLIFSPPSPKYTITVFTDVDCQYCRKLHSEMAELNRLGLRVRYMFYPRTGPNTESWHKAEAVWCAANRNEALTRAKAGGALDTSKKCGATPVAREYELGQSMGVRGTPTIITENGGYISGYLPPHDLVQEVKDLQAGKHPAS